MRYFFFFFLLTSASVKAGNPTIQAKNIKLIEKSCSSIRIAWSPGNGEFCLVTCRPAWRPKADPEDNQFFSINNHYGKGAAIGFGEENYTIFFGTDSSVLVYGLFEDSTYIFQVYAVNAPPYNYLVANSPTVTISTYTMKLDIKSEVIQKCKSKNNTEFKVLLTVPFKISGYLWTSNDTTVYGDSIRNISFKHSGFQTTEVKVMPDKGCLEQSKKKTVFIIPGVKYGEIKAKNAACIFNNVLLFDSIDFDMVSKSSYSRKWLVPNGDTFTTSRIIQNFTLPGKYKFTEIIYTFVDNKPTNCSDTFTSYIIFRDLPKFSLLSDTCIKNGDSLTIYGPSGMISYLWSDSSELKSLKLKSAGHFYLNVIDSFGCTYTDSVIIDTCQVLVNTVKKNSKIQLFRAFPIPANETLYIQTSLDCYNISLFNNLGRKEYMGQNCRQIQTNTLPSGIYYLRFSARGYSETIAVQIIH